ncbi:MAG: hypothetical protein JNG88_03830 [Phycisphaerales bacterium]|nr:hypothetical protein [Phycisphaerales bacterium]
MPTIIAAITREGSSPTSQPFGFDSPAFGLVLLIGALLAVSFMLAPVLVHWRMRRRASLEAPERLLTRLNRRSLWLFAALVIAVAVGIASTQPLTSAWRPLSLFIAALTVLSVAHITGRGWMDYLGLIFVCGVAASIAVDWLPMGGAGGLTGLGLAGFLVFWLSRFWRQQLLDGVAWTTTGRLVPKAAGVAHVSAFVALAYSLWLGYAHKRGVTLELIGPVAGGMTAFVLAAFGAALVFAAHQAGTRAGFASGVVSVLAALVCAARTIYDARTE